MHEIKSTGFKNYEAEQMRTRLCHGHSLFRPVNNPLLAHVKHLRAQCTGHSSLGLLVSRRPSLSRRHFVLRLKNSTKKNESLQLKHQVTSVYSQCRSDNIL